MTFWWKILPAGTISKTWRRCGALELNVRALRSSLQVLILSLFPCSDRCVQGTFPLSHFRRFENTSVIDREPLVQPLSVESPDCILSFTSQIFLINIDLHKNGLFNPTLWPPTILWLQTVVFCLFFLSGSCLEVCMSLLLLVVNK